MQRLGDDARRLLAASGIPDPGPLEAIATAWPEAVGAAVARSAWPRRLTRDGTLHVATVSSTWAFELDRLAPELLGGIARVLGSVPGAVVPASVRFAPGPVPEPSPEAHSATATRLTVDATAVEEGAEIAASIADAEMRELVARAAAASLARARSGA